MSEKPDFLCIGMQKAGTGFLYALCVNSDAFWMPSIKELHHFDETLPHEGRDIGSGNTERLKSRLRIANRYGQTSELKRKLINVRRLHKGKRRLDPHDFEFWSRYQDYIAAQRSDDAYISLFRSCPPDCKTGDITPAYSTLTTAQIAQVHSVLPHCSIILVVRNPVERAWSQFNMNARSQAMQETALRKDDAGTEVLMRKIMEAPEALSEFISARGFLRRAFPSRIYEDWSAVYGADRIKVVFFDDLIRDPQAVLGDIHAFLQSDKASPLSSGSAMRKPAAETKNRKESYAKVALDGASRDLLVSFFADELRACRDLFGSVADRWLVKYGLG